MLVTSTFSFSQNIFYPSQNKFPILSLIYFVVCQGLNLDKSTSLLFGKGLINWQYYKELHLYFQYPGQEFCAVSNLFITIINIYGNNR